MVVVVDIAARHVVGGGGQKAVEIAIGILANVNHDSDLVKRSMGNDMLEAVDGVVVKAWNFDNSKVSRNLVQNMEFDDLVDSSVRSFRVCILEEAKNQYKK